MITHDSGFNHLSKEGIYRSFAPNGTVLDYVLFTNGQLQIMINRIGRTANLSDTFAGVNGHDVTNLTQIYHPDKELLAMLFPPDATNSTTATKTYDESWTCGGDEEDTCPVDDCKRTQT